jgi:CobQ-like glutamine amidotransferase family enzyme
MSDRIAEGFPVLRIAHLYPALLNVAGDGGNVAALRYRANRRGIAVEVVDIGLGQGPDLVGFDLILLHGGQDAEMSIVADDLQLKAPPLREAADAGVVMLAVCAGLQLLGHSYIPGSGPSLKGAGVLDLETRAGAARVMQHAACEIHIDGGPLTVVGFENHSGATWLGSGVQALGSMIAGSGNNGVDGTEGARRDNVFATYLHGPVLPKNPRLADHLLRLALERSTGGPVDLKPLDDAIEERTHRISLDLALANQGKSTVIPPARLTRAD